MLLFGGKKTKKYEVCFLFGSLSLQVIVDALEIYW